MVVAHPSASTWPESSACMADASSSKRRISAPSGATAVSAVSCVLARATAMRTPFRSAGGLIESFLWPYSTMGGWGEGRNQQVHLVRQQEGDPVRARDGHQVESDTPILCQELSDISVVAVGLIRVVDSAVRRKIHQNANRHRALLLDFFDALRTCVQGVRRQKRSAECCGSKVEQSAACHEIEHDVPDRLMAKRCNALSGAIGWWRASIAAPFDPPATKVASTRRSRSPRPH